MSFSQLRNVFAGVEDLHVVDGLARPGCEVRFPESFTARWMSVADTGDIFAGGAVFESKSGFVNHLSSAGSNNVRAQKSVCCLLTEDLDQPVCVVVALGPAVGGKGELANVVGDALGLQLLLVLAHPGHLRVSVNHAGNAVVVNVHWSRSLVRRQPTDFWTRTAALTPTSSRMPM